MVGSGAVLGCAAAPGPTSTVTVFAASSLRGAFDDGRASFEAANPGLTLAFSFDASSVLRAQIELGAPADVFASADLENARRLVDGGSARGQEVIFARNELALIVPADDPAGITSPADLATPGLRIVAAGKDVPITRYTDALLENLGRQPGYPEGYVDAVRANIVSREDNVAGIVAKIELGEGDAAFVYVTDVSGSGRVATIPVPETAQVVASYAAVAIRDSPSQGGGDAFVAWLTGPDGRARLERFGFLGPP